MSPVKMNFRWTQPLRELRLHGNEVHVWRAHLDVSQPEFAPLAAAVSQDELVIASRFYFSADRRRFLVARAILRQILARYLRIRPEEVSFAHGPNGKPKIATEAGQWLKFNLSHSQNFALYAVACEREVGVDLERIRSELAHWKISWQFFAEGEKRALQAVADHLQTDAFFACWTRKEAYVKARAVGLSGALADFEVTVTPGPSAELVRSDSDWSICSFPVREGFAAACAVEGTDWKLRLFNWKGCYGGLSQAA